MRPEEVDVLQTYIAAGAAAARLTTRRIDAVWNFMVMIVG